MMELDGWRREEEAAAVIIRGVMILGATNKKQLDEKIAYWRSLTV